MYEKRVKTDSSPSLSLKSFREDRMMAPEFTAIIDNIVSLEGNELEVEKTKKDIIDKAIILFLFIELKP